jgi:hypothetical protein
MRCTGFREKLVEDLSNSGFVQYEAALEKIAARIGVLPDVLYEARQRYLLREKLFLEQGGGGGVKFFLSIRVGPRGLKSWETYCQNQNKHGPGILRGNLHAYLSGTYEPPLLPLKDPPKTLLISLAVTRAAKESLVRRARVLGAPYNYILQSMLVHIIRGMEFVPGPITPIPWTKMHKSVDKYFTPPNAEELL